MQYRPLGKTGLQVSEIGFGSGNGAALIARGDPEDHVRNVGRAVDLGVNYFDTSPDYGKGVSETNLGQAFRRLGIRPVITTKVEILPDQTEDIAAAVVRSIEASLKRLCLDYVDVVEIHNSPAFHATPHVKWGWMALSLGDFLAPKGALEGLERARRDGKVRFFGFGAPMEMPARANLEGRAAYVEAMKELMDMPVVRALFETGKFDLINVEYNLINPTAGVAKPPELLVDMDYAEIINVALEYSVGTAIFSPLAMGTLSDPVLKGLPLHPLSGGNRDEVAKIRAAHAQALSFLSRPGEQTLSQATYKFILMHPGVTTIIGGFAAIEHLEEAAGVSGTDPLTAEEMARVTMAWRGNFGLGRD